MAPLIQVEGLKRVARVLLHRPTHRVSGNENEGKPTYSGLWQLRSGDIHVNILSLVITRL